MAHQCQPRAFYSSAQKQPCYLGPVLKPAHLALSAGTEPKSQGHCQKWHHKLKVVWHIHVSIAIEGWIEQAPHRRLIYSCHVSCCKLHAPLTLHLPIFCGCRKYTPPEEVGHLCCARDCGLDSIRFCVCNCMFYIPTSTASFPCQHGLGPRVNKPT